MSDCPHEGPAYRCGKCKRDFCGMCRVLIPSGHADEIFLSNHTCADCRKPKETVIT